MRFVREFGLVVGGAVALLAAFLLVVLFPVTVQYGWTAYAPMTGVTFVPAPFLATTFAALLLAVVGVGLITADVVRRVVRARREIRALRHEG